MEDVLDFSADFWEKRLDYEPQDVDNIYSQEQKGLSYAIDDYCGFDPVVQWMQTPEQEKGTSSPTSPNRGSADKRRGKAKGSKHLSAANSKSHNKSVLTT